jgi:hypothetical protein
MISKILLYVQAIILLLTATNCRSTLVYKSDNLILRRNSLSDALGSFTLEDLPSFQTDSKFDLKETATPLAKKMWKIALHDIEQNKVFNNVGNYFAAGRRYTDRVYTRDIAFAGILGLNYIYPVEMLQSLKVTRDVTAKLGYKVSASHVIKEIIAPWEIIAAEEKQVMASFKCNSITRRTDDVVWIWAAEDLFNIHPEYADWQWLYKTGISNFKEFYDPWFDEKDGLFRAQPTFQDITSSGYPRGMTVSDCVLLKGASTNCIYYKAMLALAKAAKNCHLKEDAIYWNKRAQTLKNAIKKELILPNGTVSYYKDRNGQLLTNQHCLGTAFAVLFGILEGQEAKTAIINYPTTDKGIPLIYPFLADNNGDHNNASWPFCDTFFLQAKEMADKKKYTGYNTALLARTLGTKIADNQDTSWGGFGSFHEKVKLPSGIIDGSGQQLWTSAAYVNVCIRAGLVSIN